MNFSFFICRQRQLAAGDVQPSAASDSASAKFDLVGAESVLAHAGGAASGALLQPTASAHSQL